MTAFECFRRHIKDLIDEDKTSVRAIHDGTGISRGSLGEYLKGLRVPSIDQAERIATFLGIRLSELMDDAEIQVSLPRLARPIEQERLNAIRLILSADAEDIGAALIALGQRPAPIDEAEFSSG